MYNNWYKTEYCQRVYTTVVTIIFNYLIHNYLKLLDRLLNNQLIFIFYVSAAQLHIIKSTRIIQEKPSANIIQNNKYQVLPNVDKINFIQFVKRSKNCLYRVEKHNFHLIDTFHGVNDQAILLTGCLRKYYYTLFLYWMYLNCVFI